MDIGTAVVELWEKEAPVRHFYQPVPDTVFNIVCLCIVMQACFGELDRADTAEDVIVDLIGSVEHFGTVGGFAGDVVDCVDEDDVVVFTVVVVFYDSVVEGFFRLLATKLSMLIGLALPTPSIVASPSIENSTNSSAN